MWTNLGQCCRCGSDMHAAIGQHLGGGGDGLTWFRTIHCPTCRVVAIEEDYSGMPPPEVRSYLLEDGYWCVALVNGSDRLRAVAALRKLLHFDLKEAGALLRSSSPALWQGTNTEYRWLQWRLGEAGIALDVREV